MIYRPCSAAPLSLVVALTLSLDSWSLLSAADTSQAVASTPRVVVGQNGGPDGALLRRETLDKPWQPVMKGEKLYTGDLLIGLLGGVVQSSNGAVRLVLLADFDRETPLPILEPGLRLNSSANHDLAFTLERGRVDLINQKKEGAARVRVQILDRAIDVTLEKPGTRLAVIVFGRWARGARFTTKPGPRDVPIVDVMALALQGDSLIKGPLHEYRLVPPPGPALIHGSNREGEEPEPPQVLQKLPSWAFPEKIQTKDGKKILGLLKKFRQEMLRQSLDATIEAFLKAKDPDQQAIALIVLGATDDLGRLADILRNSKDPEVWDFGIMIIRHWLGRGPGQDLELYKGMLAEKKLKPARAATIMHLLHSFSDKDLSHPETYETLIAYLDHEELAIRGLAHWHLYRLVPAGRKIGYNPLAPKEERERAITEWRKLIPTGKLPPLPPSGAKSPED